jgi:drug/metabolite transporter (DMT)-like permease
VCSGFGFTLQPVAQAGTTAERAGMFCALNPLVACVLGVVFLHEHIGAQGLVGAALILTGILLSYAKLPICGKRFT